MKNWWYYHKWYVICGVAVVLILVDILGSRFHLWEKIPDCEIAYVGGSPLADEQTALLQQAFQNIGADHNQDKEVKVQLHQYIIDPAPADTEAQQRQYAGEVQLIGDITDCDSFFFITDDPGKLQRGYHILAEPDGSCPEEADYSTEDKVLVLQDALSLIGIDPETAATVFPDPLYIGIRCFYTEKTSRYAEENLTIWRNIFFKEM